MRHASLPRRPCPAVAAARRGLLAVVFGAAIVLPTPVDAGWFIKGPAWGGVRPSGPNGASSRGLLRRDRLRDGATPARPLPQDRTVHRYTTRQRAREELRRGIPPGRHMTPAHPGRPPSAEQARKQFGLPRRPELRETIDLPKGHPIRRNKVLGGRPGTPEWTSPRRVPPEAIKKVVPLQL
jgi:hypothetical protein